MVPGSLQSTTTPLAVVGDLDPTANASLTALPLLLRLHCLLRGRLLVPEQFLLFNRLLAQMWCSTHGHAELQQFLQHAPLVVSQHNRSGYATCKDHALAAMEEDHPFLAGANIDDVSAYATFLDETIPSPMRVKIDTPAAVAAFPEQFRNLASHFGISLPLTRVVEDLAARASERPGRNESRLVHDAWNRNDLFLVVNSDRFDRDARISSYAISPDQIRTEPIRSAILACGRAAYLSSLGEQLVYPDQDLLLPFPRAYDFCRSTLAATTFDSAAVRRLVNHPQQFFLPLEALGSCSWATLSQFLASNSPEMHAYFRARLLFLTAPNEEKLGCLTELAAHLYAYLQRAAVDLAPQMAPKTAVSVSWHGWHHGAEHVVRIGLIFAITALTHHLHWLVGGTFHSTAEYVVNHLFPKFSPLKTPMLASSLRASWYSAAALSATSRNE